jgi:hypothetical protein
MLTAVGLTLGIVGGMAAAGNSEPDKPALSDKTLVVAPTGDDQNPGTEAKPLASLAGARDRVRQWVAAGLQTNVQVLLRGGTYFLPETVRFDNRDSGTEAYSITYASYPGEKAVVSGGRRIAGWRPSGTGGLWRAEIPEVKTGWYPRELYVDGQRAVRARSPNADAKEPYYRVRESKLDTEAQTWQMRVHSSNFQLLPHDGIENWPNLSDVEIWIMGQCNITRKQLAKVNATNGTFLLKPPHSSWHWNRSIRQVCFLENALAFLDRPGEWYLDRATGECWYLPRAGEDMTKAEAIAPVLTRLLEVKGATNQPVRNLHFQGIAFAHATWTLPKVGYVGAQATMHCGDDFPEPPQPGRHATLWARTDAALSFEFVVNCSVEDGEIAHVGACGLELRRGSRANLIQGNHVFDIGGNGMSIGEPNDYIITSNLETRAGTVVSNRIANNLVETCGMTYTETAAIWVGLTENTLVARNEIRDLPQIGISVGWEWGGFATDCRNNIVLHNHVYDVMKILTDGAGIYTLGAQGGGVPLVQGNVVHDVRRNAFLSFETAPNAGIYFDEGGGAGFMVFSNLVYHTSPTFNFTHNPNCRYRDNLVSRDRTLFAKGPVGCAACFDNAPYSQELPHSAALEPTNLTVAAWVKVRTFPSGVHRWYVDKKFNPTVWIVNKNPNELTDGYYSLVVSNGNVGAWLNLGGGVSNRYAAWSTNTPLLSNAWNHLALTCDGRELKVYCNGVLQNSAPLDRPRVAGKGLLRLGKGADRILNGTDDNTGLEGWLDEVRIYARALSAEELRAQFAKPAAADMKNTPALVAYWPFDDLEEKMQRILAEAGPAEPWRSRLGIKTLDAKTLEEP